MIFSENRFPLFGTCSKRQDSVPGVHGRLLPVGRAEKGSFDLPFSQEIMADVLGLSVPHLNRVMQQLRADELISTRSRKVELTDMASLQRLAQYQPLTLPPIPVPGALGQGSRRTAPCPLVQLRASYKDFARLDAPALALAGELDRRSLLEFAKAVRAGGAAARHIGLPGNANGQRSAFRLTINHPPRST
jgi:Crp-like helix-turn-helix domain